MIRGGLWQKQKRTSVCSLCLYRYGLRGASRRTYSSSSEAAAWSSPSESRLSQPSSSSDNKGSTASYSNFASTGFGGVTAGSTGWSAANTGGLGSAVPPQKPTWGSQGSASWGSASGAGSGSFATGSTYELSPSELAAKERLASLGKPKITKVPVKATEQSRPPSGPVRPPPIRITRVPSSRSAFPPPRSSLRTLDYIGTLGRQDLPFSKKDDPFAPLDIEYPAPRPPMSRPPPPRQKLGLDEGNWGQLKSRRQPTPGSSGPPSSFSSFSPGPSTRSTVHNPNEFWTRAKDKFPSVELPAGRPTRGSETNRAAAAITRQSHPKTTAPASEDAWEKMTAIAVESKAKPVTQAAEDAWETMTAIAVESKAEPVTQAADASSWDWVDELPDKSTNTAEERPRSQDDPLEDQRQGEPKPKASGLGSRDGSNEAPETREFPERDRDRRGRHDQVEREDRGRRGKAQRREYAEPANDDFDEESFEEKRRRRAQRKAAKERSKQQAVEEAAPQTILLPELISVANLGAALGIKAKEFVEQMGELGFENITKDNILTGETAALVAQEYGFDAQVDMGEDEDLKPRPPPEDPSSLPLRPPVVTIMGHVDHGKTTLLDFLRKSSIVEQEHGGITQHIGAFSVNLSSGKPITFLDTPGHAAFLSMRQRGANVTDMVILVVAADDSVKPQTIEALKHARAAKVPMIVAINKVDKESANADRVKSDLAAHGVEIEDYGGDVQVVCVSGKTGQGMEDLEENILLLAEMLDIRSETDGMAEGWVLESSIKPIGRVATVLVKRGTLRPGDNIVAGNVAARIRVLRNEAGQEVDEAPPGTAVEILGWKEPPAAGDQVLQAPNEDKAKRAAHYRQEIKDRHEAVALQTKQDQDKRDKAAAEELEREMKELGEETAAAAGEQKEPGTTVVNFIIKGDVHGSVEACCASVLAIGNNEVRPRVLLSGPGQITEWEVEHAAVSGSRIINFNNSVPAHIRRLAEDAGVKILEHNVIYHMAEDVRDTLSGYLAPTVVTKVLGEIEVLQIFQINVRGRVYKPIAGCKVRNGQVLRKAKVRVMRDNEEVFKGMIDDLKQGKKDVTEVKKGSECGISFDSDWADFRQGDIIQPIEEVSEKRQL